MPKERFTITTVEWERHKSALREIRESVFIVEQHVPKQLEWDDKDETSLHVIATDATGEGIGTGRITSEGQIGRMAVLCEWRNTGVGSALLQRLIELANQHKMHSLFLNAQKKAIPFYQQHGFKCIGDEFMEAGIPHHRMEQKS